jgi:cysteine synthase A
VDVFISGVGTGGTLTGVSRYIKGTKGKKDLITVAVEPTDSPVISQALAGEELKPAQNSGYRRRLHSWQPGSEAGG